MSKIIKYLITVFFFLFSINSIFAQITFDDITLINNSIHNDSNLFININIYDSGPNSTGIDNDTNVNVVINPRINVGDYANLLLSANDENAFQYCLEKYDESFIKYETIVTENLFAYYDRGEWKSSNGWSTNKISKIYCNAKDLNVSLYYNLDNSGDIEIDGDSLDYHLILLNLTQTIHNISFYATNGNENVSSGILIFNVSQPSTRCILPSGIFIEDGENVTLFENFEVNFEETCNSELRICNNGVLNGTFEFFSCDNLFNPKPQLIFDNLSLENNYWFKGNELEINLSLININYSSNIILDPVRNTTEHFNLDVIADLDSVSQICLEELNSDYYNFTTKLNNYIGAHWSEGNWLTKKKYGMIPKFERVHCRGLSNIASLYYTIDGGDKKFVSYDIVDNSFKISNLSYSVHSIRFYANQTPENSIVSPLYYFTNVEEKEGGLNPPVLLDKGRIEEISKEIDIDVQIKEPKAVLNEVPKEIDKEVIEKVEEKSIVTKILDWFSNLF